MAAIDTTKAALYTAGTRIWLPDTANVWKSAELTKDFAPPLLEYEDEHLHEGTLKISSDGDLPHLRNPDILVGQNDLTSMSYLHEPAVLHNLRHRFIEKGTIYTYCGIVLVAINPYTELGIYSNDLVSVYRGRALGELDPHIFAVAEEAYAKMERDGRDQSIIVSGESGAGKTVSAKYAMRYFALVGGSESVTTVEKRVIASSPIMEAIGNAKTTRNDNSSRFGKYVELQFDKYLSIKGASMRTYLLEKSRVVFQASGERNYHIFYQLCASQSHEELQGLKLGPATSFAYTRQGKAEIIDGLDDARVFAETIESLILLGFEPEERRNFFALLAAILHLGNIQISGDRESSKIANDDKALATFCDLLLIDPSVVRKWLINRKIATGREEIVKGMSHAEASVSRDALAKLLYASAFAWIVKGINSALTASGKPPRFIGVLDIYGFETFAINSFEQFCINYANEKLQQQFNSHVFKLEQEEYVREGIQWTFISFADNQPTIDLIETKLGILDLLDEETRVPNGSDSSWVQKLHSKCSKWECFAKPRMSNSAFIVKHFADSVEYESSGFLEKNRDTVLKEQIAAVGSSKIKWLSNLAAEHLEGEGAGAGRKRTVGREFRESLTLLMASLNATTPHYVRCIKPNDEKESFSFDPKRAVQQLRACGVLETIRISAAGFPSRWTFADFFARYRVLCHSKDIKKNNAKTISSILLQNLIKNEEEYRFGKTKIFFRAGQVAFMEKRRYERLMKCAILMQKTIRGWLCRRRYVRKMKAIRGIQTFGRGMLARRLAKKLRETAAATKIQANIRKFLVRRKYLHTKAMTVRLQTCARGYLARAKANRMKREKAAVKIQKTVRGWLQKKKYDKTMHGIIIVQSIVRKWLAKRRFRALRAEANTLQHAKKLNKGLENKIFSLQQRIDVMSKDLKGVEKLKTENAAYKKDLENLRGLEAQLKAALAELAKAESLRETLEGKLRKEKEEKVDIINEKEKFELLASESAKKEKDAQIALEALQAKSVVREAVNATAAKDRQNSILEEKEREDERRAYQLLLAKYNDAEVKLQAYESTGKQPVPLPRKKIKEEFPSSGFNSLNSNNSSVVEDVGLLILFQQKLKEACDEKDRLYKAIEILEEENPCSEKRRTQDLIRLQELEMENSKLRQNLGELRESKDGIIAKQMALMEEELSRRREESIQLRTVLASPKRGGEDEGETGIILATQKAVVRQLENELQEEKSGRKVETEGLRKELKELRADRDRVKTLLSREISKEDLKDPFAFEITRLASENLEIRGKLEELGEAHRDLNQRLRGRSEQGVIIEGPSGMVIRKKDRTYQGMFEYKPMDEAKVLKILILDLKTAVARNCGNPTLPAYILIMCIRWTDYLNDDEKVKSLLSTSVQNVKKVVKKKGPSDIEVTTMWASNILRLLHTLKQYSGDSTFQAHNTPKQNEQALKNFDLSEYRQVFSDVAVWVITLLIKGMEDQLQSLIVPGVLESEMDMGGGMSSPGGKQTGTAGALYNLRAKLVNFYNILNTYLVDKDVIIQIFKQLYYYICAGALNNLLLRKDLCHWSKGMRMRMNINFLEEWSNSKGMGTTVTEAIIPLVQATKVLQALAALKTDQTANVICENSDSLTMPQILKLVNLYTTEDEYEGRISMEFLKKVQTRLLELRREEVQAQSGGAPPQLLMDTKFTYAIKFPFNPSDVCLEHVEIPENFGLSDILKRI